LRPSPIHQLEHYSFAVDVTISRAQVICQLSAYSADVLNILLSMKLINSYKKNQVKTTSQEIQSLQVFKIKYYYNKQFLKYNMLSDHFKSYLIFK